MGKKDFLRLMNSALLSWYKFSKCANLMYIVDGDNEDKPLEVFGDVHVYISGINQLKKDDFLYNYKGYFEYVIIIDSLETCMNPDDVLTRCWKLLGENGKLLLGVNNRLGLKFLCGEKELYTGKVFEGIEGYSGGLSSADNKGRCYNLHEWKNLLEKSGIYINLLKILSFLIRYSIIKCRKNIRIRTKTLHSGENPCINSNDIVSLDLQISTSRWA